MRPDRIILGEVRGGEALDMLQAMNTGHEGSLTTIHANDARDALSRLEVMVAMAGFDLPIEVVRRYIASAINVIVHLSRLKGGVRRVMRIAEVVDLERNDYQLRELFRFQQAGLDAQGLATGRFHVSGNVPAFLDRLRERGIALDADVFRARVLGEAGERAAGSGEQEAGSGEQAAENGEQGAGSTKETLP
jgi:pilus assembly protein CpaF